MADLCPGPCGSAPQGIAALAGRIFFSADDGAGGRELWVSDGTREGAQLFLDIRQGSPGSFPVPVGATGTHLFLKTDAFPLRQRLLTLDFAGRVQAIVPCYNVECGTVSMTPFRDFVLLGLSEAGRNILWRVDLPSRDATPLRTFPGPEEQAPPHDFAVVSNGLVLFVVSESGSGEELWATDVTEEGTFKNPLAGGAVTQARAIPGTGDTGYFWFFEETNFELAVKILDGTPVNGKHRVFWGALSDVEYTLTVIDTIDLNVPRGRVCGGADTSAF